MKLDRSSTIFLSSVTLVAIIIAFFVIYNAFDLGAPSLQTTQSQPVDTNQIQVGGSQTTTFASTTPITMKNYSSSQYGFSFSYPSNLDLVVFSPEHISLGFTDAGIFVSRVDISIMKSTPEIQIQSFEDFVLSQAEQSCLRVSSGISYTCTGIDTLVNIKPFTSKTGSMGQVFSLMGQAKTLSTGNTSIISRGPFYTWNTTAFTPNSLSFLMINNPVTNDSSQADLSDIQLIANSVTIQH